MPFGFDKKIFFGSVLFLSCILIILILFHLPQKIFAEKDSDKDSSTSKPSITSTTTSALVTVPPVFHVSTTSSPTGTGGTSGGGNSVSLIFSLGIDDIGSVGDNQDPKGPGNAHPRHIQRQAAFSIYDKNQKIAQKINSNIFFDNSTGLFSQTLNSVGLSSGTYTVFISTPGFLEKQLGTINVSSNQTFQFPQSNLVAGDINSDNSLDILDYNDLVSCYGRLQQTSSCLFKQTADIDDDGVVDGIDYNIFIRELKYGSQSSGDDFSGPVTLIPPFTGSTPTPVGTANTTSSVGSLTSTGKCNTNISFVNGNYLKANGTRFSYMGNRVCLYGATIYGSSGSATDSSCGTPPSGSWSGSYTSRIDWDLCMAKKANLNFIRLTNYADGASDDPFNPAIWKNIDYLVSQAQSKGIFILMDLSSYAKHLMAQNTNPYLSNQYAGWQKFISFVTSKYKNSPNIAYYSIRGEVPPIGTAPAYTSCSNSQCYIDFYNNATNAVFVGDGGNHLIEAGGLTHIDSSSHSYPPSTGILWQSIFGLPHVDIAAIHVYAANRLDPINGSNDLHFTLPDVAAWAKKNNKPVDLQEYGVVNQVGDQARGSAMQTIEQAAIDNGYSSIVYWNLGPETTSGQHYDVNPGFPLSWQQLINGAGTFYNN